MTYTHLTEISRVIHGRTYLVFTKNSTEFLNRMFNKQLQTKAYLGLKSLAEEARPFFSGRTPAKSRESLKYLLGCLLNIKNTQVCLGFVVLVFLIECSKCSQTIFGGFISTARLYTFCSFYSALPLGERCSRTWMYTSEQRICARTWTSVPHTTVSVLYSVSPVSSLCFCTL